MISNGAEGLSVVSCSVVDVVSDTLVGDDVVGASVSLLGFSVVCGDWMYWPL